MPPLAVPVTPVGPVAAASMVFRDAGALQVAAIVKATFSFEPHGLTGIAAPEAIFAREAHRMNNPTRSIVATSDLVPRLPGVDVLLLGHAQALGGSAAYCSVRLALGRGDETLIDKTVQVVGDRKGGEIRSFQSMPLVFEKAFGGPGNRDNPLGTGSLAGDPLPNLVFPDAPDRVACFAPISRTWPARTALAAAEVRGALEKALAELPSGFDYRYFHAAPADQRTEHLLGEEWLVLEGVHPEHEEIRLVLPGARAMVRVIGTESDGRVFSLRADTLRIDVDAQRLTLVWRNSFPVRESDLPHLHLLAGVALPDAPVVWPSHAPAQTSPSPRASHPTAAQTSNGTLILDDEPPLATTLGGTMEVADEDIESVHFGGAAPDFSSTTVLGRTQVPTTVRLPDLAAPPTFGMPAPAAVVGRDVRPSPARALRASSLDGAASGPIPQRAARAGRDIKESTLDLSHDFAAVGRAILPFDGKRAAPGPAPEPRPAGPIPGAPWAPERSSPTPFEEVSTFDADGVDLSGTLASPTGSRAPTPEPAAPPRVAMPAPISIPVPTRVDIQTSSAPSSLFDSSSPDSAPTHIRELAPRALSERSMAVAGRLESQSPPAAMVVPLASPLPVFPEPPSSAPVTIAIPVLAAPAIAAPAIVTPAIAMPANSIPTPAHAIAAPASDPAIMAPPSTPATATPPSAHAIAAPPSAPVVATPPSAPVAAEPPSGDPWGQSLRDEPTASAPEAHAPRPSEPGPNLRSSLYKRFKK